MNKPLTQENKNADVSMLDDYLRSSRKNILERSEDEDAYLVFMPHELEFLGKYKEQHPNWKNE